MTPHQTTHRWLTGWSGLVSAGLLAALTLAVAEVRGADSAPFREYDVKAVFLFNFAQFYPVTSYLYLLIVSSNVL